MHDRHGEAPTLVWAVRLELDNILAQHSGSQQPQEGLVDELLKVAAVTSADGFSFLLFRLLQLGPAHGESSGWAERLAAVLATCLESSHLRPAVLPALRQWHSEPPAAAAAVPCSLLELCESSGLGARAQVVLAELCLDAEEPWPGQGVRLLSSLLRSPALRQNPSAVPLDQLRSACLASIDKGLALDVSAADLAQLPGFESVADAIPGLTGDASPADQTRIVPAAEASTDASRPPDPSSPPDNVIQSAPDAKAPPAAQHPPSAKAVEGPGPLAASAPTGTAPGSQVPVGPEPADPGNMNPPVVADALREAGPRTSHSRAQLQELLSGFPAPTVLDLAHVMAMVAATASAASFRMASRGDPTEQWDTAMLASVLSETYSSIAWAPVFSSLDIEAFVIEDEVGFKALLAMWEGLGRGPFPVDSFVSRTWHNLIGQLSFLNYAVYEPPERIDFSKHPSTIEPLEHTNVENEPRLLNSLANRSWYCIDLLAILVVASEQGEEPLARVLKILDIPSRRIPEILVLGFGLLPNASYINGHLPRQVLASMGPPLVGTPQVGMQVMHRLQEKNFPMLQLLLKYAYKEDATALTNILNCVQELKVLQPMLNDEDMMFVLDLAVLANRREFLNLERWLPNFISKDRDGALEAIAKFLTVKLDPTHSAKQVPLEASSLQQIAAVLLSILPALTPRQKVLLKPAMRLALGTNPTGPLQQVAHLLENTWSKDVQERADQLFNELYEKGEDGVMAMVEQMRQMVAGPDIDVAEYIMHDLVEEVPFFHKYPEDKLQTTGCLIGTLLAQNVLLHRSKFVGLKMILECLEAPPDPAKPNEPPLIRTLALHALRCLSPAYKDYGTFCERVLKSKFAFKDAPEMYDTILRSVQENHMGFEAAPGLSSQQVATGPPPGLPAVAVQVQQDEREVADGADAAAPAVAAEARSAAVPALPLEAVALPKPVATQAPAVMPQRQQQRLEPGAMQPTNTSTVQQPIPKPDDKTCDRVYFLLNNITDVKLVSTCEELNGLIAEPFHHWFADYLVMQRAANEGNLQAVYVKALLQMQRKELMRTVLKVSYQSIRVLLAGSTQSLRSDAHVRTMLKSLGTWLGKVTLARNVPIMRRELDVKAVIVNAYANGHLISVIPFVLKLFMEGANSSVFSSMKNPWVRSIMALLKEIYESPNLKLALKFDVENAAKTFAVKMDEIEASRIVANVQRVVGSENPDFKAWQPAPDSAGPAAAAAKLGPPGLDPVMDRLQTPGMPLYQPKVPAPPGMEAMDGPGGPGGVPAVGPRPVSPPQPSTPRRNHAAILDQLQQNLHRYVRIPVELQQYSEAWQLPAIVPVAVDRAVAEIMQAAVERSVTISCKATTHLVRKDFVHDVDEERLRESAKLMVSALAGSLATVTCRDVLQSGLVQHFKHCLKNVVPEDTKEEVLEQAALLLMHANHAIGCEFIERIAMDKAVLDVEQELQPAFDVRRHHNPSQPFMDQHAGVELPPSLPSMLLLDLNRPAQLQQAVYGSFARANFAAPQWAGAEARFSLWMKQFDQFTSSNPAWTFHPMGDNPGQKSVVESLLNLSADMNDVSATKWMVAQLFNRVWVTHRRPGGYMVSMAIYLLERLLSDTGTPPRDFVSSTWLKLEDGHRWKEGLLEPFLKGLLLETGDVDAQLAENLEQLAQNVEQYAVNAAATAAASCVQVVDRLISLVVVEQNFFIHDIQATIAALRESRPAFKASPQVDKMIASTLARADDALQKLGLLPGSSLTGQLAAALNPRMSYMEEVHSSTYPGSTQREQALNLIEEWHKKCSSAGGPPSEESTSEFINTLKHSGIVTEASLKVFIRVSLDMLVLNAQQLACCADPPSDTLVLDHFILLLGAIAQRYEQMGSFVSVAIGAASELFSEVVKRRRGALLPKPFLRIFTGMLHELTLNTDVVPPQMGLGPFLHFLRTMEPGTVPMFAFAWLELVSNPKFMQVLLNLPKQQGCMYYNQLLTHMLAFLEPRIRSGPLSPAIKTLYKGIMRLLFVLLHEHPEVLSMNHVSLCHRIPPRCLQLRNMVLSAYPKGMKSPDPFMSSSKIDQLPESSVEPPLQLPPWELLLGKQLHASVDAYFSPAPGDTNATTAFLADLPRRLLAPAGTEATTAYNTLAMTGLVLFVGVKDMQLNGRGVAAKQSGAAYQLYLSLVRALKADGLFQFFTALVDQLRYPSAHTFYFHSVALALFADGGSVPELRDVLTRVLLERRLAVPHVWGADVLLAELLCNRQYDLKAYDFVKSQREVSEFVERLMRREFQGPAGSQGLLQSMASRMGQVT